MNGLMLHAGASVVSRTELFDAPTPKNTDSWFPIPHSALLEEFEGQIKEAGFDIVNEAHGLDIAGNRYFGLMELKNGSNADDFGLVVGLRNSHDKTFPAAVALGSKVFVCDNLSFSGEVKMARRHTTNIMRDLPATVTMAISRLTTLRQTQEQRFEAYKNHVLTDKDVHDVLMRSIDIGIPVTKIKAIREEWHQPRHNDFSDRNAWSLWNAYTEILKSGNHANIDRLGELTNRTQKLHGLFDIETGIVGKTYNVENLSLN